MGTVVVIWSLLLLLGVLALAGLALPRDVRRPREISAWLADHARRRREEAKQRAAEAAECRRYADEVAVAARGAEGTAERRRAECQAAQTRVEESWQAYRRADAALERARRAAAYPGRNLIDRTERERALRRAAQAAHRRGDLSDEQLLDALTHRNGWSGLHPVEQELALARAAAAHRFALYRAALTAEDAAWRAADVATAAVRSLRREAAAAAARAEAAQAALPRPENGPRVRRALVRLSSAS